MAWRHSFRSLLRSPAMKPVHVLFTLALSITTGACVPQPRYDAAVKDATDARLALDAKQKELARVTADLAACTGKPVPTDHSSELAAQLAELSRQKAAAEARVALFNDFIAKFKKMIDAGKVSIHVRRGRIVLTLHNDVLFDEGKTDLKPAGKQALTEIGHTLGTVGSRSFQVSGHTDNLPIKTRDYASNWELSTERAVVVVKFLSLQGVSPNVLSAAGYGEFDPVAPNSDAAGRTKNRRIEISLVPNIEELISLPELKGDAPPSTPGS
jgi:chemotaxis protein MotB